MCQTRAQPRRLITATSAIDDADGAARDIKAQLSGVDCALLLVFFSSNRSPEAMARAVSMHFPFVLVAGCSTAGEIHNGRMQLSSMTVIAFPKADFHIVADLIEDVHRLTIQRAYETGRRLRQHFTVQRKEERVRAKTFAIMLVDGLSNREEIVVTAARCAVGDIPLIGGSAGDSQLFREATLIFNGRVARNAAILLLVETDLPFQTFRMQNFTPTAQRFVVTAADPEARIVYELNASPAAPEYARAIGLDASELSPASFAAYPMVVRAGTDYYCRAIREVNADGSLTFFCAIDEGLVLSLAEQQDIVTAAGEHFAEIDQAVGGIDSVLGFDCFLRRIEVENRQVVREMEALYRRYHLQGFNTYGEQFNGIHLNQTLTGLALGRPRNGQTRTEVKTEAKAGAFR